tara:strand:+ start:7643 stop:9376 length:1734 start_codon:yes stop_codon:yes gene_type:complete
MRNSFIYLIIFFTISCNTLDLNPLSEGSSENWYSNDAEIEMAVNYLFDIDFWDLELLRTSTGNHGYSMQWADKYSDNWTARNGLSEVDGGSINSQTSFVNFMWNNTYKCIAAANRLLISLEGTTAPVTEEKLLIYEANARFVRASQYSKLIFHFGDVPYYENILEIEEAFSLSRSSKEEILAKIYDDYDFAIANLPEVYGGSDVAYATKGAALAMKARIALYMGDFEVANEAAKACIDLGNYSLYPDYEELFLSSTKNSQETIFSTPRSTALGLIIPDVGRAKEPLPRIVGGFANGGPSWSLLASYLCTDGLPIDESPLFDPQNPFSNRDPRCTATIVEFGTKWLGFDYQPHPDSLTTMNYATGTHVSNTDNRAVLQYASYNALVWKKKVNEDWLDLRTDNDNIIIRFADVLHIYAEAKIELDEIDQSVLDALNKVRSRAYGVEYTDVGSYPEITTMDQTELRKVLRIERRMEFAFEGTRWHDIFRWKLAEKVLNQPIYGILDPDELRTNVVDQGLWFWSSIPAIDEDGIPDFSTMFNAGHCKLLALRVFDPNKQYLLPIPSTEIEINPNISQNPNY